jgi:ADP-ribosylglycohydrolase
MQRNIKKEKYLVGAISGDIIGSVYEFHNVKTTDFNLFSDKSTFTDDSVLTFATMDSLLHNIDYATVYQNYGRTYTHRGYGSRFHAWLMEEHPVMLSVKTFYPGNASK